jgi:Uma2 family endonuclease
MEAQTEFQSMIGSLFPPQGQWQEYHFFLLPESNQIIELANGVISMSPGPTTEHQIAVVKLTSRLDAFVSNHNLGVVLAAPYDVRLFHGTVRQPDVLFLRNEHRDRLSEKLLDGAPDWVAEVISPGTREADEIAKLAEYAQAGVSEYWLVDPENRTVRVHTLADGEYEVTASFAETETASSPTIPGFEIPLRLLFPE